MFGKGKNEEMKPTLSGATIVAKGTSISGTISSENDLRIDGELKGRIESTAKVVVGQSGMVYGDIVCRHADVMGQVEGNIEASEQLCLRSKAVLVGDITTASLELENEAQFNGRCIMNSQKELVAEKPNKKEKQKKSTGVEEQLLAPALS